MNGDVKSKRFYFRLSENENKLFEENFKITGLKSRGEFIRSLVTTYKAPCKLDKFKLAELRLLVSGLGRNNGLLKYHVIDLEFNEHNNEKIIELLKDVEKLKNRIKSLIENMELELGFVYGS